MRIKAGMYFQRTEVPYRGQREIMMNGLIGCTVEVGFINDRGIAVCALAAAPPDVLSAERVRQRRQVVDIGLPLAALAAPYFTAVRFRQPREARILPRRRLELSR